MNENSEYQKARIKPSSVNDVNAMSLFPYLQLKIPNSYYVVLFNSYLIFKYKRDFINSTSAFQINDARQIPIIIPTKEIILDFENFFNEAMDIKSLELDPKISKREIEIKYENLQQKIDSYVYELYGVK